MNLYRIICFETFIDLLHNKRERYVRPSSWEDTFEGYLFSKLYEENKLREIVEDIYYNVCPKNYYATILNVFKLEFAKWFVYGQCWSKLKESDAMWRIYSYGERAIQIKTTDTRLNNLLKKIDNIGYEISSVKYDVVSEDDFIHTQMLHTQIKQLKDTGNIREPFLHKRKAFKHEREKRALISNLEYYGITDMDIRGAVWQIDDEMKKLSADNEKIDVIIRRVNDYFNRWSKKVIPESFYVENIDLQRYISSVVVNPFAPDWYVELIGGLCQEYGIKFEGKSQLYKKGV